MSETLTPTWPVPLNHRPTPGRSLLDPIAGYRHWRSGLTSARLVTPVVDDDQAEPAPG